MSNIKFTDYWLEAERYCFYLFCTHYVSWVFGLCRELYRLCRELWGLCREFVFSDVCAVSYEFCAVTTLGHRSLTLVLSPTFSLFFFFFKSSKLKTRLPPRHSNVAEPSHGTRMSPHRTTTLECRRTEPRHSNVAVPNHGTRVDIRLK